MTDESDGGPGDVDPTADVDVTDTDTSEREGSVTRDGDESDRRAQLLMDLVLGSTDTDIRCERPTLEALQARVGTRLGNYVLHALIGAGGMGAVYRAEHVKLKSLVALKLLIEPRAEARFIEEARTKERLHHPNVVRLHEFHPTLRFFTMPLMSAGTLADRMDRYVGHPRKAAALVEVLARALHYIHTHEIIHRDIKPTNILFDKEGDDASPYVADFGICKREQPRLGEHAVTKQGGFVGSYPYAAPEQVAADGDVTTLTDVYNLGFILYELVTGSVPIESAGPRDNVKILTQEPPPLSTFGVRVDRNLEVIILRCLRKDAADRYASAQDLADDLRRYLEDRPIEGRRVGWFERLRLAARRRPAAFVVAAALLAASAAQPLVSLVSARREDRQKVEQSLQAEARPFAISTYFQLMLYAVPLVELGARPELRDALAARDPEKGQRLLEAEAARLVRQGLASEVNLFVVDKGGSAFARTPATRPAQPVQPGEFASRDYVRGALALRGSGMSGVHLSQAFASRFDTRKKLALSIAIRDDHGNDLGVLAMYWASAPQLGRLQKLSNARRTFALAVEAEPNLGQPSGEPSAEATRRPKQHIVILHPDYKNTAVVDAQFVESPALAKLGEPDPRQPELRFDGQAMEEEREAAYDPHYLDPVAVDAKERVATMMPVGNTRLIAIVSQSPDDSSELLSRLELHALGGLGAASVGIAAALIALVLIRRRKRDTE